MELKFLGRDSGFGEKNNSAYYEADKKLTIIDCGYTVFNIIKEKFDLNNYDTIEVIITHLHNDHAGSLSQLILYTWFVFHKKVTVISNCKHIDEYLKITGAPQEAYELKTSTENVKFIKTEHVKDLDCYGFMLTFDNDNIIYTGDTATLKPFEAYFPKISAIYIDVSSSGGVHLNINDILPELKKLKAQNINIYLMHMDNKELIKDITNNEFFTD